MARLHRSTPGAKRVCMVVDNGWPDTRVEREARAILRSGYAVDVICVRGRDERSRQASDGLTIFRLPVARRRGMSTGVQLLEYLTFLGLAALKLCMLDGRRRYQVIHVHNVPDFLVFAAIWPKLRGARVILDIHDLMPEFFASRFGDGRWAWLGGLVRLQERLATRFADHVITVTEPWRRRLIERGLPPGKVSVVMNLPDDEVFRPMGHDERPEAESYTLLYHGTLTYRYGIDLLIEAVARARRDVPVRLIIHGAGEYLPSLQQQADRLTADGTIRFSTDVLPTDELPRLIASADVGVVPNRLDGFTDGILPTKLLEYVAVGIPAIVARTSATTEHFDDTMVRYFTPGDVDELAAAIVELYHQPEKRRALAVRASTFTESHTWQAAAEAYVSLVDSLPRRSTWRA